MKSSAGIRQVRERTASACKRRRMQLCPVSQDEGKGAGSVDASVAQPWKLNPSPCGAVNLSDATFVSELEIVNRPYFILPSHLLIKKIK